MNRNVQEDLQAPPPMAKAILPELQCPGGKSDSAGKAIETPLCVNKMERQEPSKDLSHSHRVMNSGKDTNGEPKGGLLTNGNELRDGLSSERNMVTELP